MHSHFTTNISPHTNTDDEFRYIEQSSQKYQVLWLFVNIDSIIVGNTVAHDAWVIPMWKFYFKENSLMVYVDYAMT